MFQGTTRRSARQAHREANGRYARMNRCELCGRRLGIEYASLPGSDTSGIGLVLCPDGSCAKRRQGMTDEEIVAAIRERRGADGGGHA